MSDNRIIGTMSNIFTVGIASIYGKIVYSLTKGAANKKLIVTNTALTADRTIAYPDDSGTIALTKQLHTQNTDSGTTGSSFTVKSAATTGKIILSVTAGASNKSLTITNTALTADRTITFPDASGVPALTTAVAPMTFANMTPGYAAYSTAGSGGRNAPFVNIGSWDAPMNINLASDHWVPIQVNLKNSGNASFDVAAARLRVDTGATNALAAVGCLQLRQNLGHNVASSAILNASVNISAAVAVQTGSLLGGYFSIEGSGAVTKAGDNDCTPLVAVNNNTGGGIDNVFLACQNGTGTNVDEIVKAVITNGTATNMFSAHVKASKTGTSAFHANNEGTLTNFLTLEGTAPTNLINLDGITAANGKCVSTSGSAAETFSGRIRIIMPDGNPGYLNVYSVSNEAA